MRLPAGLILIEPITEEQTPGGLWIKAENMPPKAIVKQLGDHLTSDGKSYRYIAEVGEIVLLKEGHASQTIEVEGKILRVVANVDVLVVY